MFVSFPFPMTPPVDWWENHTADLSVPCVVALGTKNIQHVSTVNNIKVMKFTYYKHHSFMSTFTGCWIYTTLYVMEKRKWKKNNNQIVLFKTIKHNISDDFYLT
jgi:F0F1-type ATP synthase membrane subunit a